MANGSEVIVIQAHQCSTSIVSNSNVRAMHTPDLTPIVQDRHQDSLQQMQTQVDGIAAMNDAAEHAPKNHQPLL